MDYLQTRELYHYGIKGQKWGVRRYTNEDGTLTQEGQRKYNELHKYQELDSRYNNVVGKRKIGDPDYDAKIRQYNNQRDKVDAQHAEALERINQGEQVYRNLDKRLMKQVIKEDNNQIKAGEKRAKKAKLIVGGVIVASILVGRKLKAKTANSPIEPVKIKTVVTPSVVSTGTAIAEYIPAVHHSLMLNDLTSANNELQHYGIKGQKWGVRRFINEDGSLTTSGRARYNPDLSRKKAIDMTDDDLAKSNKRLAAESQYKQFAEKDIRDAQRIGASVLGSFMLSAGSVYAYNAIDKGSMHVGKNAVGKAMAIGGLAAAAALTTGLVSTQGGNVTRVQANSYYPANKK